MPSQHTTEEEANQEQKIKVPLELAGLRILKQEVQADGTIQVKAIGTKARANCPHDGGVSVKQHEVRLRRKRDVPLREISDQVGAAQTTVLVHRTTGLVGDHSKVGQTERFLKRMLPCHLSLDGLLGKRCSLRTED